MSPAGAAAASFRSPRSPAPFVGAALLVIGLVGLVLVLSGGSAAHASPTPAIPPLTPAWQQFQTACVQGPSPGNGNPGAACVCWEQHLEAVAIGPADALDILTAAQEGQGAAYTVRENIGNEAVNQAMNGCDLYAQR